MRRFSVVALALVGLVITLPGCGGGGGTSGSDSGTSGTSGTVAGIDLPTEVSAISAKNTQQVQASLGRSLHALRAVVADLPADSDYKKAVTAKYVDEPTLEVFGIIETILQAVAQTHYADEENVGAGPYKTLVAWYEEENGASIKELEEWIVDSSMVDGVNQVDIWINNPTEPVQVRARIAQAPTQDGEGEYVNYGAWTIHANMGAGEDFGGEFYAEAEVDEFGSAILRMSEDFSEQQTFEGAETAITLRNRTKAVMHKAAAAGYGVAQIANWDYCWEGVDFGIGEESPCLTEAVGGVFTLPAKAMRYAYNDDYLALQPLDAEGAAGSIVYKDRIDQVNINYRYGLFRETDGKDVQKLKNFGFPVFYTDDDVRRHGYYGAWEGRHQLWAGSEGTLPDGTTVTEETWGDNEVGANYTVRSFNGTLAKRTLTDASLGQIEGIPLEIWLGRGFDLRYAEADSAWHECSWNPQGGTEGFGEFECSQEAFDLATLVVPEDSRKEVHIDNCDENGCTNYAYNPGTGLFDEVTMVGDQLQPTGQSLMPVDGTQVFVWLGGATYVTYSSVEGWLEKELIDFDAETYTPTFGTDDQPFDFPVGGQEYYVNNRGVNFVVSQPTAGNFVVKMEQQTVARPNNAGTFLAGVAYLANPWEDVDTRTEYVLDTNAASDNYMLLVNAATNQVVDQSMWGLTAFNASDESLGLQFNWEPASSGGWGRLTYLVDGDGNLVYLDDPISLQPLTLTTLGGDEVTFSLQYDGWMHGLPDLHWELEKNGFEITDDLRNKIVNIPTDTLVTDQESYQYYVKPLEVGVVLATDDSPTNPPDLTPAELLDLDGFTIPTWVDTGAMPSGTILKYIEGKAVTE